MRAPLRLMSRLPQPATPQTAAKREHNAKVLQQAKTGAHRLGRDQSRATTDRQHPVAFPARKAPATSALRQEGIAAPVSARLACQPSALALATLGLDKLARCSCRAALVRRFSRLGTAEQRDEHHHQLEYRGSDHGGRTLRSGRADHRAGRAAERTGLPDCMARNQARSAPAPAIDYPATTSSASTPRRPRSPRSGSCGVLQRPGPCRYHRRPIPQLEAAVQQRIRARNRARLAAPSTAPRPGRPRPTRSYPFAAPSTIPIQRSDQHLRPAKMAATYRAVRSSPGSVAPRPVAPRDSLVLGARPS